MRIPLLSRSLTLLPLLLLAFAAAACSGGSQAPPPESAQPSEAPVTAPVARAVLEPLGDSGVSGWVSFTAVDDGVRVEAQVTGLTPGDHGFHVHQWGDCSSPDGKSAGGHFNPAGVAHAAPDAPEAHAGDLGNIVANDEGVAVLDVVSHRFSLEEGAANSILGRGVIVHAGTDDLTSQPSGAAGPRVACGVILLEGGQSAPLLAPTE